MSNSITTQTILDGPLNAVIKVLIDGDGIEGDESSTNILDTSGLSGSPSTVKLIGLKAHLSGFSVDLEWDASTNVVAVTIPGDDDVNQDYRQFGGIINNAGSGVTGDIDISTAGLGDESGYFIMELQKS